MLSREEILERLREMAGHDRRCSRDMSLTPTVSEQPRINAEAKRQLHNIAEVLLGQRDDARHAGNSGKAQAYEAASSQLRSWLSRALPVEGERPVCAFCETLPDGVVVQYCGSCEAMRNEARSRP